MTTYNEATTEAAVITKLTARYFETLKGAYEYLEEVKGDVNFAIDRGDMAEVKSGSKVIDRITRNLDFANKSMMVNSDNATAIRNIIKLVEKA